MPKYDDWLEAFLRGKSEVPSLKLSDQFAVHSIRRFLEGKDRVWEIAITYTDCLVVRSGQIGADGITVAWSEWATERDVEVPKVE